MMGETRGMLGPPAGHVKEMPLCRQDEEDTALAWTAHGFQEGRLAEQVSSGSSKKYGLAAIVINMRREVLVKETMFVVK
jgi:hypothetical protein